MNEYRDAVAAARARTRHDRDKLSFWTSQATAQVGADGEPNETYTPLGLGGGACIPANRILSTICFFGKKDQATMITGVCAEGGWMMDGRTLFAMSCV
jgi:hypothetical protein